MSDIANFAVTETLRDGRRIGVRALKPEDRDGLVAAVQKMSDTSVRRRFFGVRRYFSEEETSRFVNIDFRDHVALVAAPDTPGGPIVAGARYVMITPGRAEVACAVTDQFQGHGLGTILIRHLAQIAKQNGVRELIAEVLPENSAMLNVFENAGYPVVLKRQSGVVHVVMQLQPFS
jgi:RimJ/RimL family protein N-acetyltransferase